MSSHRHALMAILCVSAAPLWAGEEARLPEWRIDDGPTMRDNGLRGEVVLNGVWKLTTKDGKEIKALVPGQVPDLKLPKNAPPDTPKPVQHAWREFEVPAAWAGRQLKLEIATTQTCELKVDGEPAGNVRGAFIEYDLPAKPGWRRIEVSGPGGIVNDVWLRAYPAGPAHVDDSYIVTSYRRGEVSVRLEGRAAPQAKLTAQVAISERPDGAPVKELSAVVTAGADGRWTAEPVAAWKDAKLWNRDAPNLYWYTVSLVGADGKAVDRQLPRRFGFREVWIQDGQLMVNGVQTNMYSDAWHRYMDRGGNSCREQLKAQMLSARAQGITYAGFNSEVAFDLADELGFTGARPIGSVIRLNVWNPKNGFTAMNGEERMDEIERTVRRFREHPSILHWISNAPYSQVSMHPEMVGRYPESWNYFPLNRASEPCREAQYIFRAFQEDIRKVDPTRAVSSNQGPFTEIDCTTRYLTNNLDLQEREEFHESWWRATRKQVLSVSEWGSPFTAEYYLRAIDFQLPQSKGLNGVPPKLFQEMIARYEGERIYAEVADEEEIAIARANGYDARRYVPFQRHASENVRNTVRAWRTYGLNLMAHHILSEDGFPQRKKGADPKTRFGIEAIADPRIPGEAFIEGGGWPMPEHDEAWPVAKVFADSHQPLYAYIGGADGRFIAKDHMWFAGAEVRKSVVVINDFASDVAVDGSWRLVDNAGKQVVGGDLRTTVKAGARELKALTIAFPAPEVAERTDYAIEVQLKAGRPGILADRFAITVFPKRAAPRPPAFAGTVWMLNISDDMTHETRHFEHNRDNEALLRAAGLDPKLVAGLKTFTWIDNSIPGAMALHKERQAITEGAPQPGDLLIIPRGTLAVGGDEKQLNLRLLARLGLDQLVAQGLRVLVLEQNLPNIMGMNTESARPRRAFIAAHGHPVFAGLADADLSYWSGSSDLCPSVTPTGTGETSFPERMWHVSNTNAVASMTLIRPQTGACRALAVSGFDLGESPLLEVVRGKGRMVFCQFDVTNRYGIDPAATRLFDNLVSYVLTAPEPDPAKSELGDAGQTVAKRNLLRAARPAGSEAWGITLGELFFRESLYRRNWSHKPESDVPVLAASADQPQPQVIGRAADGRLALSLKEEACETGWGRRKVAWIRSALIVNQGGSRSDGPALAHHGRITDLYPHAWVEDFVHPYNANIW